MPRIISGQYKGLHLKAPKGEHTRPTSDKVKESLFSIIQTIIPDARVLDIFAGSGQIGLEALSRGAQSAFFLERDARAIAMIKTNIDAVDEKENAVVLSGDVFRSLRYLGKQRAQFDIVFLDPPYQIAKKNFKQVATLLFKYELLRSDAVVIVEHASKDNFDENVMNLTLSRRCKYGATMLTFYNRESNMEDKV